MTLTTPQVLPSNLTFPRKKINLYSITKGMEVLHPGKSYSLLNTSPLCMTNFTFPSAVMSLSGSPCTAITSA
jgi:hypothetical protein